MTGMRFGRLVALSNEGRRNYPSSRAYFWNCRCDCGNTTVVDGGALRSMHIQSCGCLFIEKRNEAATKHGLRRHPSYGVWKSMIDRCTNPKSTKFSYYGGRGIGVCESWLRVETFILDMGICPVGFTLERIDNNKGYSPENCKWATLFEQSRNKRSNRMFTYQGVTQCVADWARQFNISELSLRSRLNIGWSFEDAISQPIRPGLALKHRTITAKVQP